jgi:hypothetical protein
MKTIEVNVTEAQFRYFRSLSSQLAGFLLGDFILANACIGIDFNQEGRIEILIAALDQFVRKRHVPTLEANDMFEYGITSRPAIPGGTKITPGAGSDSPHAVCRN